MLSHWRCVDHRCRLSGCSTSSLWQGCRAGGSISRRALFARDEWSCVYCGTSGGRLTLDHVVPRSRGGDSVWENVVTACAACNLRKADRQDVVHVMRDRGGEEPRRRPFLGRDRLRLKRHVPHTRVGGRLVLGRRHEPGIVRHIRRELGAIAGAQRERAGADGERGGAAERVGFGGPAVDGAQRVLGVQPGVVVHADRNDRHLPPTEKRLREARAEGQVARSRDLGHFAILAVGLMLLAASPGGATSTTSRRG